MTPEQKVALAISGWLVGANQATDNFQVAVSLAHVRDMVLQLSARAAAAKRVPMAAELRDMEGGVGRARGPDPQAHEAAARRCRRTPSAARGCSS